MNEKKPQTEWIGRQHRLRRLRLRNILINAVCILMAGYGLYWVADYFRLYMTYEITNDAIVDQYVVPVNVRVAGYIADVRFTEHQYVSQGDTLVVLDDREYRIRLDDAMAALMDAEAAQQAVRSGIETSEMNIAVQQANIAETKARLWQQRQELRRYENLLKEESVSLQQYEQVKAGCEATQARYEALLHQKQVAESQYGETTKRDKSAEAQILRKRSELDMARLNLSYTTITAPYDGYMGRRTIERGQYVQGGQTLTYLVRGDDKWITANYKETQIAHIFIGQKVRVKVDALPGRTFYGRVTAISEATGSKYALVPTDNAAGNFVKVQQRIPVRIDLQDVSCEDMALLRAGMMVVTEAEKR